MSRTLKSVLLTVTTGVLLLGCSQNDNASVSKTDSKETKETLAKEEEKNKENSLKSTSFTSYSGTWTENRDTCGNGAGAILKFENANTATIIGSMTIGGTKDMDCENANIDEITTTDGLFGDVKLTFNEKGIGETRVVAGRESDVPLHIKIELKNEEVLFTTKRVPPINSSSEIYFKDDTYVLKREH